MAENLLDTSVPRREPLGAFHHESIPAIFLSSRGGKS